MPTDHRANSSDSAAAQPFANNPAHLGDIELEVTAEFARKSLSVRQAKELCAGNVIVFDKLAGEAFDLLANGLPFAEGEIVVIHDNMMSIRVTRMLHAPEPSEPEPATPLPHGAAPQPNQGSELVFIPPGPFTMGGRDEDSPRSERPAHTVVLTGYYIDLYPVTNQQYRDFAQATGHRLPLHWAHGTYPASTGNHPVVNVSWHDACAYAEWAGKRLPTEAEWEKAARGTDERPYPWGTPFTEGERCNAYNQVGTTTRVDEYPDGRSYYGVWDMAGNVYEWCQDYFDEEYYKSSPATNPKGPEGGRERVVRGGCYVESRAALRTTHREGVTEVTARDTIGFRCAVDL